MTRKLIVIVAVLLASASGSLRANQQTVPGTTPEEMRTYSAFRTWITGQGPDVQRRPADAVYERYSAELRRQGKTDAEIKSTIDILKKVGDRLRLG